MREEAKENKTTSWADVAARGAGTAMAISEDMEEGVVAAEVATPVALLREDDSSTPLREINPHHGRKTNTRKRSSRQDRIKGKTLEVGIMWPPNMSRAPMT